MTNKYIVKNLSKYNNIKIALGLDLKEYSKQPRSIRGEKIGISTMTYGKNWFITPKGKAIFKSFDGQFGKEIKNVRIVNELLCNELCKQIGLSCAEYELATYGNANGVVSYDIAGENKLINLRQFLSVDKQAKPNLIDCAEVVDKYISAGVKMDKQQTIISLYKIILFDTLTLQTDRNARNINFVFNKKEKSMELAKLIDNEFAFCGERIVDWIENNYGSLLTMHDITNEYSNLGKIFTFDGEYVNNSKQFKNNVHNLIVYAKKYPELQKILNNTLLKIDIKTALKKVEQMGVVINSDYKQYVEKLVNNVKNIIIEEKNKDFKNEIEFLENIM